MHVYTPRPIFFIFIFNFSARAVKLLQDHEKFFEEEAKLRVDESKRAGKAKSAGDIFGMEGSFKKLDLD